MILTSFCDLSGDPALKTANSPGLTPCLVSFGFSLGPSLSVGVTQASLSLLFLIIFKVFY